MSRKKNHAPGPVPPDNRPQSGPPDAAGTTDQPTGSEENAGASFQEQDAKRRLGGYGGAGEHPRQQPGVLNDGDRHSR